MTSLQQRLQEGLFKVNVLEGSGTERSQCFTMARDEGFDSREMTSALSQTGDIYSSTKSSGTPVSGCSQQQPLPTRGLQQLGKSPEPPHTL